MNTQSYLKKLLKKLKKRIQNFTWKKMKRNKLKVNMKLPNKMISPNRLCCYSHGKIAVSLKILVIWKTNHNIPKMYFFMEINHLTNNLH
jgi:hypothetical protein